MRVAGVCEAGSWALKIIEDTHNHGPSVAPIAHPGHRIATLPPEIRVEIIHNWQAGISNSKILSSLYIGFLEVLLTPSDLTNITQVERRRILSGKSPIE